MDHSRNEKTQYIRTSLEWELLGDLCSRLHRTADAKECYQFYLDKRYNFRVWTKLVRILSNESKMVTILGACEKLVSVLDRWRWGEIIVRYYSIVYVILESYVCCLCFYQQIGSSTWCCNCSFEYSNKQICKENRKITFEDCRLVRGVYELK